MRSIVIALLLLSGYASAHQFTPTYPVLTQSYMDKVLKAEMELFNSRKDIEYYELAVYDGDWNTIPFAAESRLVKLPYLGRKSITIYIRSADKDRVVYICSQSKTLAGVKQTTVVSSKICSKVVSS